MRAFFSVYCLGRIFLGPRDLSTSPYCTQVRFRHSSQPLPTQQKRHAIQYEPNNRVVVSFHFPRRLTPQIIHSPDGVPCPPTRRQAMKAHAVFVGLEWMTFRSIQKLLLQRPRQRVPGIFHCSTRLHSDFVLALTFSSQFNSWEVLPSFIPSAPFSTLYKPSSQAQIGAIHRFPPPPVHGIILIAHMVQHSKLTLSPFYQEQKTHERLTNTKKRLVRQ